MTKKHNPHASVYVATTFDKILSEGFDPKDKRAITTGRNVKGNSEMLKQANMGVLALAEDTDYEDAVLWNTDQVIPSDENVAHIIVCDNLLQDMTLQDEFHLCYALNRVAEKNCILIVTVSQKGRNVSINAFIKRMQDVTTRTHTWKVVDKSEFSVTLQKELRG